MLTIRCYEKAGNLKYLLVNEAQTPGFFIEGDLVLDPFSGSGTTALACKNLNRNFIGSELNKEHYLNSLERLSLPPFINPGSKKKTNNK